LAIPLKKECTKPQNQDFIKKRHEEYFKSKGKTHKGGRGDRGNGGRDGGNKNVKSPKGKWAPPTQAEQNKRTIDGVPMWYNKTKKRWYKDKFPLAGAQVNVSTPTPPQGQPAVPAAAQSAPAGNVAREQQIAQMSASLTNVERMYQSGIKTLCDQIAEL